MNTYQPLADLTTIICIAVHRDHAKLLWQRIPCEVKEANPAIKDLWEIGKKLWKREFAEVYSLALTPSWPTYLEPIITSLVGEFMIQFFVTFLAACVRQFLTQYTAVLCCVTLSCLVRLQSR